MSGNLVYWITRLRLGMTDCQIMLTIIILWALISLLWHGDGLWRDHSAMGIDVPDDQLPAEKQAVSRMYRMKLRTKIQSQSCGRRSGNRPGRTETIHRAAAYHSTCSVGQRLAIGHAHTPDVPKRRAR